MRKISTVIAILCCSLFSKAQTFSWNGYAPIRDFQTDTIPVTVSGLPVVIDTGFGLSKVCFDISHTFKSNLLIKLISPDGNIVVLVENEGGASNNFSGTCLAMNGVPFELGTSPYTGTFLPVSDISVLNNGQNPNAIWRIIITDQAASDTGHVSSASITFTNNPTRGLGLGGSNFGPPGPFVKAGIICPGGASGCDLLPDMTASALNILSDHSELPGILKISNATPNIGYGPMEIYGIDSCFCDNAPSPCNVTCPNGTVLKHIVRQRIYRKIPGTDTLDYYDRDAGAMTYHPEHGHLHVDDWGSFTLRSATSDPDPRNWPIIGTSVKQSYCLVNLGTCAGNPGFCVDNNGGTILTVPNNGFGYQTGCGLNQGIWPGSLDIYSQGLNEPILLDDICNGTYYIVSITDPENKFLESDETNNWVAVPITLTHQSTTPHIKASVTPYLCSATDSIILTSTTSPRYLWSTGATTKSIVVKAPGTFTVNTACGVSPPFTVSYLPADAVPAVSVGIVSGSNPSCPNLPITFKATPVYGGTTPVYQWKVNGTTMASTSDTYTSSSLANGQKVSCTMISGITCFHGSGQQANSDSITVQISPANNFVAVVKQTKGYNPFCLGDTVSFTAEALPGINPVYHWMVDGVETGGDTAVFTSTTLQAGQLISCTINALPSCAQYVPIGTAVDYNQVQVIEPVPYPTWYGNGRQQYLIKAIELLSQGVVAGPLSKMSFITGSNVGDPAILNNYTIKLANVGNVALTSTMLSPVFTTVFGPVSYVPVVSDTNTHNFITPFVWDGASNLLIDICFSNQVIGNGNYQTLYANTSFISSAMYAADGTQGASACFTTTGGTTSTKRPVIYFANGTTKNVNSNQIALEQLKPIYHFTGNGDWSIAANWENSIVPPKHVLHCAEIIIDPVINGECILTTPQVVAPGAKITVVAGKKFRVVGNVLVQE